MPTEPPRPVDDFRQWLLRAAWLAAMAFSLLTLAFGPAARFAELSTLCTGGPCQEDSTWLTPAGAANLQPVGLSLQAYAGLNVGVQALGQLLCVGLSGLLAWRGGQDRAAAIFAVLLAFQANLAAPEVAPAGWLGTLFTLNQFFQATSVMAFLFLFPTGTFVPRWAGIYLAVWLAFNLVFRYFLTLPPALWFALDNAQWMVTIALALGAQIYRYYWRSSPIQRLQTRWLVAVFVGNIAATLLLEATSPAPGSALFVTNNLVSSLINPLMFVVVVIAIRRHRLWDIDLIIRRTLIYTVLSVAFAAVYFGSLVVLQAVVQPLTGEGDSTLVTVLSTLGIAALFGPLRRRVQGFIDRRFYRRKYDAAQIVSAFGGALRDEVELERLTTQLIETVDGIMQPAHASLWLRTPRR